MSFQEMRIAIGNTSVRMSETEKLVLSILDDLDGCLVMSDADIKASRWVLDERLRVIFGKLETQRKRISYLESVQPPPKKPGRKKAPARPEK